MARFELLKIDSFMTDLDNRIKELQRAGKHGNSHNTLSIGDIRKIFQYLEADENRQRAYLDRLIFAIGLSTGLQPGAMHQLKVSQLKLETVRCIPVIMFYATIGGTDGENKTDRGGFHTVADRPRVFPIPGEYILGGLINLYAIIKEYMDFRADYWTGSDRFFIAKRTQIGTGTGLHRYFKRQNLGRNSFSSIVTRVCKDAGVESDGANETVTSHGLRGTMTTLLIDAGYDDSTITL